MTLRPNIVYLHSHDTGRHIQPYGHQVPTPSIQRLADQGLLFRQAFSAAPVCSGSRAALLTGEYSHTNGMLGLAHRGYRLADYDHHLVHTLRDAGYHSTLIGEQHLSSNPAEIGYDEIVEIDSSHAEKIAPATAALLRAGDHREPFFLSVGFFETHRDYFEPTSVRDALYSLPPANLPDTPETRRDMAAYKASARSLDQGVGAVLNALDEAELADTTLVILTTDHGLAFPGAKATLTDRGLGVLLIMRGPGGFDGGRVSDALVSQIDLFPTVCELAGIERPEWIRGRSLLPLLRRETQEINDAVFAEISFHAAYEPQRAVRTRRYKYIRRFENGHEGPVLANIDDSPSKDYLLAQGLADRALAEEELFDLVFDPNEAANLASDPAHHGVLAELRERLLRWMEDTEDPLLLGPIAPSQGTEINHPAQRSPADPTIVVDRR
jgi:N-sulfoglucosamine sulfohydrolase